MRRRGHPGAAGYDERVTDTQTQRYETSTADAELQVRENLGPDGDHAEKQRDRCESGSFLNDGAKHDRLPDIQNERRT